MSRRHRLVTLVFSHYNEKARWALDYCGISYEEHRFMPGFSQLGAMAATRGHGGRADSVSSRWSTPVLVTADREVLTDSTDIALWASRQVGAGDGPLFPDRAVIDMVEELGRDFGPHSRRIAYWHVLRGSLVMKRLADDNVGRVQALAFRMVAPLGARMIRRALNVTEDGYRRSFERVSEWIARIEHTLAGQRHLCGDVFTAADLTFAALFAPLVLIGRDDGYGAALPALDDLQPDTRDLITAMRGTRAGAFARDIYRHHRGERYRTGADSAA
ncbi:MAG TPA: glutathione S-transferase N-terminal domain-containing protein [Kofleriaceae bacterium]|nr:glutathione S-transferase N-terminal domain-containing protein [Kofleriaceae bacterium]